MIPAYSPEARGRSERMFKSLQGRIPQELALAGIKEKKEANHYLKRKLIPKLNAKFKLKSEEAVTCFVPWIDHHIKLKEILSIQEERQVNKDNTVSCKGKTLQIERNKHRNSYAKVKVKVHEYGNGEMSIFYGANCVGRYDQDVELKQEKKETKIAA